VADQLLQIICFSVNLIRYWTKEIWNCIVCPADLGVMRWNRVRCRRQQPHHSSSDIVCREDRCVYRESCGHIPRTLVPPYISNK